MANVEERVLSMKFDNAAFQRGVAETLQSLDSLNKGLQLQGSTKGLDGLGRAANAQTGALKNVEAGVDAIANKFKTMSIVGITALTNIANRAVTAGTNMVKSFTVGPIIDGFHEYETTLNSIQTVLANTGLSGKKGLDKVNKALNELNHYSDKTIYNFTEMAKNVGTFTAAGVKLKTSVAAIKGIANLAAVSGSTADQASTAMYQLSQALAAGSVKLQDWISVRNAGMGGKVFQDALKDTARVHGIAIDQMIKNEGDFAHSLHTGWLSSKILTETLNKFTGDMSNKQLKALGYTQKQITAIQKMAKTAVDSATKVKTFSQLMGTLREAVGSGWTTTWTTVFGNFNEAKKLFTNVNNVLGGFIQNSAKARNKVLGDWKAFGGRTVLIDSIRLAFNALLAVMKPIKEAFRSIFPATTGKDLYELTKTFHVFTEGLLIGSQTADNLRRTFAGVFAIFGIGWEIIKQVTKTLFGLFQTAGEGSGGFLDTTASIGDFFVAVHKAIVEGTGLTRFFKTLGTVLAFPIKVLQFIGSLLKELFQHINTAGARKMFTDLGKSMSPLGTTGDKIITSWDKVAAVFGRVYQAVRNFTAKVTGQFGKVGDSVDGVSGKFQFKDLLATLNTAFFGGLVLLVKKFVGRRREDNPLTGIFRGVGEAIEHLTGVLKGMQHALNAAALLQIAAAVALLAVSMSTLSKIDAAGLERSGIAITAMMTQLGVALFAFQKISTFSGLVKMPIIMGSMILLAGALNTLALAVKQLSSLSWGELTRGLVGIAGAMAIMITAVKYMPNAAGLAFSARGMVVLAGAIKIMASAVSDLGKLSWEQLSKGLIGVGALLTSLTLFTKFSQVNIGGIAQGAGIILLAVGIKILASAMKDLGKLSWEEIAKGIVAMAGSLVIISAALSIIPPSSIFSAAAIFVVASSLELIGIGMKKMGTMDWETIGKGLLVMAGALVLISAALILIPPSSLLSAAAILVVAVSLGLIGDALNKMGKMSWESIGKSIVLLAASLTIIAAAMIAMLPALPGAAALLVVSGALAILTPVLIALGNMSWESILKGLLALAGVFVVLGVAGLVMGPLVPVLLGLGVAIALLGIGLLATGAGVFLFAAGLTALAASGVAGGIALAAFIGALAGTLPVVAKQIGLAVITFARVIATAGPALLAAFTTIILAILKTMDKLGPKIVDTVLKIMNKMLESALKYIPKMTDTGLKLVRGILDGIAKNADGLVTSGTNAIIAFINGIKKSSPRLLQSGADLIVSFLNSLAATIRKNSPAIRKAALNVADAIIEGMTGGLLKGGASKVASAAKSVADGALNAAKHALGINSPSKEFEKLGKFVNEGFAKGLNGKSKQDVLDAFNNLKGMLKDAMKSSAADVKDATAKLKELTGARTLDVKAIQKARDALAEARKEHNLSTAAYTVLTKKLGDEKDKLASLANQYEKVTAKLEAAKSTLEDAKRTRDDYNKNIKDQFSTLPDITTDTNLPDYISSLQQDVRDTQEFATTVQKLRDMGLNDAVYQELLSKGAEALPFMRQLLSSGKYGVDQINRIDGELSTLATNLGKKASTELYQAGVDSAQALVNGLEKQQDKLVSVMEKLAEKMVEAMNRALGTGLSEAFSTVTVNGNGKKGKAKSKAVAPQASLGAVQPVVDLTNTNKTVSGFSVNSSYSLAKNTASAVKDVNAIATIAAAASTKNITYNQYNTSPKALAAAEVYRQTKNQLSTVKGA